MEKQLKKKGFSIVELLTVMSIIAILIGLLVPALNLVRRMAKDTKQKNQFHSIHIALEIYNGEQESYPDSYARVTNSIYTVGAQHLAEALVGRDLLGYDPASRWDAENDESIAMIYASKDPPKNATDDDVEDSLDRRKGPYLNPENVEAYQLSQLYTDTTVGTGDVYPGNLANDGTPDTTASPAPVLTDAYRIKTVTVGSRQVKAGSPILYYKANTSSRIFDYTDPTNSIFDIYDNDDLVGLGTIKDQINVKHKIDSAETDAVQKFYEETIYNPKITSMDRPYNQSSYILISAGHDGIYGTSDDIFNFNE